MGMYGCGGVRTVHETECSLEVGRLMAIQKQKLHTTQGTRANIPSIPPPVKESVKVYFN